MNIMNLPSSFWWSVVTHLLAAGFGMLIMWMIGKFYPGAVFGVTTMRDRISNRLSEMRYRREHEMRRR